MTSSGGAPSLGSDALAPYDAVLVLSYGGPDGPDAVLPFLRNATAGRGIPDERLAEVGAHYALFGGVSPINERNAEFTAHLAAGLVVAGSSARVVVGCRNWHPFLSDTLRSLASVGARRVLAVLTSGYSSYSSCRQYRDDIARALAETGVDVDIDVIGPYAESAGFVEANADALVAALAPLPGASVLFVTHSLPGSMADASGPGLAEGRYVAQHLRVAEAVASRASATLGRPVEWELTFCSRSGPPQVPWLEPDVNDRLRALAAGGARSVVCAPIGFVSDHMEVVYDLDTQAAATASEVGLGFGRAATAGTHPAFVSELVSRLLDRAAAERGERPALVSQTCGAGCCGSGRPVGAGRPGGAARPGADTPAAAASEGRG